MAAGEGPGAAGVEAAAPGQPRQAGHRARNGRQAGFVARAGQGADQPGRVRMQGAGEKRRHVAVFGHLSGIHDGRVVAGLGHHPQVVGDEQDGRALGGGQVQHEGQDLLLDGDVQGRGGFVGDEQVRGQAQGHGDHHPLAHASGKLMGKAGQAAFGIGDAHQGQHASSLGQGLAPGLAPMQADGLGDLLAHPQDGIERGHGLLEDHGDAVAAHPAHGVRGEGAQVRAVEEHPPGVHASRRLHQPQNGQPEHRLAAPGLADHGQGLAPGQGQAYAVHGHGRSLGGVEGGAHVENGKQGVRHGGRGLLRRSAVPGHATCFEAWFQGRSMERRHAPGDRGRNIPVLQRKGGAFSVHAGPVDGIAGHAGEGAGIARPGDGASISRVALEGDSLWPQKGPNPSERMPPGPWPWPGGGKAPGPCGRRPGRCAARPGTGR
ncbi:hypothetical protein ASZ90_000913 [hydrocarbon metagenome]|uniref:Uncharacterized protein n=1 Tax=hydrocarbon metagenome TaxID=938273 RepID=A0A0W8G7S2_9ZZZZ